MTDLNTVKINSLMQDVCCHRVDIDNLLDRVEKLESAENYRQQDEDVSLAQKAAELRGTTTTTADTARKLIQRLAKRLDLLHCQYNVPNQSALIDEAHAYLDQPKPQAPPKPPSLKEQALKTLEEAPGPDYPRAMTVLNAEQHALIRRALEQLDD